MANQTSRRALGLAALLAPIVAVAASAEPAASTASPEIRRLWAELVAARAACNEFEVNDPPYREMLVARWGEIPHGSSRQKHWGHDPDQVRLSVSMEESNRLTGVESDAFDALLDYPARSAGDVAHKLAAVLDVWRHTLMDDPDYHDKTALHFMVDAERALYDLLPAERLARVVV